MAVGSQHVDCCATEQQPAGSATATTDVRPMGTALLASAVTRTSKGVRLIRLVPLTGVASVGPQHDDAMPPPATTGPEQTPVSGSTNSTRRAASQSPANAATTERACS